MSNRFWKSDDRVKLKICGVDSLGFALDCYDLGVDALGLHIWKHEFSSGVWKLKQSLFNNIISVLPTDMSLVLVTNIVDAKRLLVILDSCKVDTIQLHNYIDPEKMTYIIERIKKKRQNLKFIGVVSMNKSEFANPKKLAEEYSQIYDAVLIDTSWIGGSGRSHNWRHSADIIKKINCLSILAGGLTVDNVMAAIRAAKPFAIDVESGVERIFQIESLKLKTKSILKVQQLLHVMRGNL